MKSLAMIPVKNNPKTGKYRLSTQAIFSQKIYGQRNLVETVNSVEKRIFDGKNTSRSTTLRNKETKVKNMLYNIYRTLIIIENAQKTNNKTKQKETDTTTQTKLKTNTTKNPIQEITNNKEQTTII